MKNTYYFPHDYHARNDPKLEELFLKMGCEGRGIYWTLIEMLYENNGYLPLADKVEYYANALRTQSERIASVINDYALFKNNKKQFWSESCLQRIKHLEEKREKARQSSYKRWNKDANAMPSECDGIPIKESKVKESKVNNKYIQQVLDHFNSTCHKNLSLTKERERVIQKCLDSGRTEDQIKTAITNFSKDDWADRHKYCDLVYAIGTVRGIDNFDKWLNYKQKPESIL